MAVEVVIPLMGLGEEKGKIVRWLKNEGDKVEKGEILFELETDKVLTEIESPTSGVLKKILIPEGIEAPIGTVAAYITAIDEELPEIYKTQAILEQAAKISTISMEQQVKESEIIASRTEVGIKATPLVRKLAKEHSVDLSTVIGTGPGGRITTEDVLSASKTIDREEQYPPYKELTLAEKVEPLSSMREIIAKRMIESFKTPHFYLTLEIDAANLKELRQQVLPMIKKSINIDVTITDFIILATATAIEENPAINCAYIDGKAKLFNRIDIGLVTAVEGGLLVPVIRNANKKSLLEITQVRAELVKKARDRKLTKYEMSDSTFTISNLGMFGIDWFSAILQPPEPAILAIGRIADKAVVREGQVVSRPLMIVTLSIDHRIIDGKIGAEFLRSLKDYLENPITLLLK